MKTKFWILATGMLLALSVGLSAWLFRPGQKASTVQILSDGQVLHTLPLAQDRTLTVTTSRGSNTVTVRDGKVAVTDADCPDGYCMARGFCDGGAQIVCLPNRLVIAFLGNSEIDGILG